MNTRKKQSCHTWPALSAAQMVGVQGKGDDTQESEKKAPMDPPPAA